MNAYSLIFLSERDAFARFQRAAPPLQPITIRAPQALMPALIDRRAALILLDGAQDSWQALILACKSSAATRRIPLCFASDDAASRGTAIDCGADLALSWQELHSSFSGIVTTYARIPDPARQRQLECECGAGLPPLALQGIKQFNRGAYYQQHDLFEALWMATAGPVRDLYRAILQIGVAYYQVERGNYRGALKMLQRSVQWLNPLPDVCQSLHVAQLRRDSYAVRAELQRLGPKRMAEFDRALLKPLPLLPQAPST